MEAGGEHLRLETPHGIVHLWRPADYDPATAGIVVYVHGYFTAVDQTWTDDRLAAQFQASGLNALFIVPQAPQSVEDEIAWTSIGALLQAVDESRSFPVPGGPLVVVGHSGAFRTIMNWLGDPRMRSVILLDALYRGLREFHTWLLSAPGSKSHRMVLVAKDTVRESDRFARRVPGTARRSRIPEEFSAFTPRELRARLLYLRSQYEHLEIIGNGKVIPLLLRLTALKPLAPSQKSLGDSPPTRPDLSARVARRAAAAAAPAVSPCGRSLP